MYKKALLFRFSNIIGSVAFLTYPLPSPFWLLKLPTFAESTALPQTFLITVFWILPRMRQRFWKQNLCQPQTLRKKMYYFNGSEIVIDRAKLLCPAEKV